MINAKEAMYELTLALLYLSKFSEKEYGFKIEKSWKGYDFHVLNQLVDEDYIRDGKHPSRTKSVFITESGIIKAKQILEKYNISDWDK